MVQKTMVKALLDSRVLRNAGDGCASSPSPPTHKLYIHVWAVVPGEL